MVHKAARPIRLGVEDHEYTKKLFDETKPTPKKGTNVVAIGVIVSLVLLGGIGAGVGVVVSGANSDETIAPVTAPSESPSKGPTESPTFSPTSPTPTQSPTAFPTRSPTGPTTLSPTASPVPTVTFNCEDPDAVCGCDLVQSELIDILWIVDESGSIDNNDFQAMKDGIIEFINNTNTVGESGSRFGWIQFNINVFEDEVVELTDFLNKELLINEIAGKPQRRGGTNQKAALARALTYFQDPDNAFRESSQRIVIMLTDGNPCTFSTEQDYDARGELKALADYSEANQQNFTFFYLPIGDNIFLELFDSDFSGIIDLSYCGPDQGDTLQLFPVDNGLIEGESFIKLPIGDFPLLSETLRTELKIPLGPCITPPPT